MSAWFRCTWNYHANNVNKFTEAVFRQCCNPIYGRFLFTQWKKSTTMENNIAWYYLIHGWHHLGSTLCFGMHKSWNLSWINANKQIQLQLWTSIDHVPNRFVHCVVHLSSSMFVRYDPRSGTSLRVFGPRPVIREVRCNMLCDSMFMIYLHVVDITPA